MAHLIDLERFLVSIYWKPLLDGSTSCDWKQVSNTFLEGTEIGGQINGFDNFDDAKDFCSQLPSKYCKGITYTGRDPCLVRVPGPLVDLCGLVQVSPSQELNISQELVAQSLRQLERYRIYVLNVTKQHIQKSVSR